MSGGRVSLIIPTYNRKDDLVECLDSVFLLDYKNLEVIVSDDCSTDDTVDVVRAKFPSVKIVVNEKNSGASVTRNRGMDAAQDCDFYFFLDSDTTIDRSALKHLVEVMEDRPDAGMCGPKIYYHDKPDRIWYAGATINLVTGKTSYRGGEIDRGQFDEVVRTGHVPTAFLVRREVVRKIGGFDPVYFIICEESDFAERAIKAGFSIYYVPKAKVWHKLSFSGFDEADQKVQNALGVRNPERAYLVSRNRIIYMRKHSDPLKRLVFYFCFLPAITSWYVIGSIFFRRFDIAWGTLRGLGSGLCVTLNDR